jgi:hypothetical protein
MQICEDKIVQAYTDNQYFPDFKYIAADEFQVTTTQSTTNWCCGSLTSRNGPDSKKLTPQEISFVCDLLPTLVQWKETIFQGEKKNVKWNAPEIIKKSEDGQPGQPIQVLFYVAW